MDSKKNQPLTLIERVKNLLNDGKTQAAFELITKSKQENAEMENARAVCLMRLRKFQEAVSVLVPVVFPGRAVGVPSGTPVIYIANLAISMLKVNNITGALSLDRQIDPKDRSHPAAIKLDQTIKTWKQSLSFFEKITLAWGSAPSNPVVIENPVGDLE
jgi:hypothetical protein